MAGLNRPHPKVHAGLRGTLLFLLPLPLLLKALGSVWHGDVSALIAAGGSYILFLAGALVARRGFAREIEYQERPLTGPPPTPLKAFAAVIIGVATLVSALFAAGNEIPIALLLGIGAAAGFFLHYGFDARENAISGQTHGVTRDEMEQVLSEGYGKLDRLKNLRRGIQSRDVQRYIGHVMSSIERLLETIERNPRFLRQAWSFLSVLQDGVQQIAERHAEGGRQTASMELENDDCALLADLEKVCREQQGKLLHDDAVDMDFQIDVLSTRLARGGLAESGKLQSEGI